MNAALQARAENARGLERAIGFGVAAVAGLVLVGWAFDMHALKLESLGQVSVKANSAVALLLCGVATALSAHADADAGTRARPAVIMGLAAVAGLIGALTLTEELFGIDFGIDELLFADPDRAPRVVRPGRMAPVVAFCCVATGLALALSTLPQRLRLRLPVAAALGTAVAVIGAMALAAHFSKVALGLSWGGAATMAVATAGAFVLLGIAGLLRARRLQAKRWALGRGGLAGFVVGALLMLGAAELAGGFALDMQRATVQVVQTQQALNELLQVRTDLRTLESAQNAYLLTGDDSLLSTRESTKAAVRQRLGSLFDLLAHEGLPTADLAPLRLAIERRLAHGDGLIALQRAEGFEAARRAFASGAALPTSREIAARTNALAEGLGARLELQQRRLKAVTTTTFLLLPLASLLGLTAFLCGVFFLDKGLANRRLAEQALLRSRTQLQIVFDNMSEGIRVIDAQRRVVQMNPAGATAHGLIDRATSLADLATLLETRNADGELLDVDDYPSARALRGDFVHDLEIEFRRRDGGAMRIAEITTAALPGEADEPPHIVVTSRDVTARKRDEAALRASQDRLERVVENLSSGLLIHGLHADRLHWNRAALAIHGLEVDTVAAMSLADFQGMFELSELDGRVLPFERWPMSRLVRGEMLPRTELEVRRLDRDWTRVFAFEGASVHDGTSAPLIFLTVTDVTARKRAELALHQLNAELEQRVTQRTTELQSKTHELESFCYSVSHDLKAPLRGIDGYSRLLADDYADQLDAEARMFIGNVRTAAAQMNELIDDLLAYSQQERRTWRPTRIRLRELVENQIERRHDTLVGVDLQVDVDDVWVHADREGLEMALRNLIDNALKFSARSQPPVLRIRNDVQGDRVVLSVQDNGTGFDMRYHDKMFEIFQRLHRAEDYPGTGIGLAMVRKAMERMGGRVWAEGRPGEGSSFHLELERATDSPDTVQ